MGHWPAAVLRRAKACPDLLILMTFNVFRSDKPIARWTAGSYTAHVLP